MKLSSIRFQNFKSLLEADFEPTQFGCLVGENNAGKSSVLQGIAYALKRPTSLSPELYYDRSAPVEFKMYFEDITQGDLGRLEDGQRSKIEPLIKGGALTLFVRYALNEKVAVTIGKPLPRAAKYRDDQIDALFSGKKGSAVKATLVTEFPEFAADAPDELNIGRAKAYLAEKIAGLPADQFEAGEVPLPSGMSASITNLLPEPIYIPAVKDIQDDLKTTQSTSFGRLLGLLLDDMLPDLAIVKQALDSLDKLFNRIEGGEDGRHQKVRDLESLIEGFLSANFPRVKLELRVPPPELKTILNNAQLFVDDGSRDLIENKGDGIKRTMTFALLQAYVHRQSAYSAVPDVSPRPLLFLFEEPELYLHPRSQRILFDTLSKISTTHQVVVTTHSPLFYAPGVTAAFVRVAKASREPKPVANLYKVNFSLDVESAEVFRLARFDNADAAFFSRRVVLFEGESDDAYCKHISKLLNPEWDFDKYNVALVRVSGKGNFPRYRRFFEAFGIEVKVLADLDALFEGHDQLGVCEEASALRAKMIQAVDTRIATLGTRAEPSTRQIRDRLSKNSYRERYEAAREALAAVKSSGALAENTVQRLDDLFVWEQPIARVKVCREDANARSYLTPTLDAFRSRGICVLSSGAIEDYYPEGVSASGPKPDRALSAAKLVNSADVARSLSSPLEEGREPELCDIFQELFRDLA